MPTFVLKCNNEECGKSIETSPTTTYSKAIEIKCECGSGMHIEVQPVRGRVLGFSAENGYHRETLSYDGNHPGVKLYLSMAVPFCGKTSLISQLTEIYPYAKIVNFELFWKPGCSIASQYDAYYNQVIEYSKNNLVFGESVSSYSDTRNFSHLNILADPGLAVQILVMEQYKQVFGEDLFKQRSGGLSAEKMRSYLKLPKEYLVYRWNNFGEIKEAIERYVGN